MKKCIYVVEDNAGVRDMIEYLLTEEDFEVKTCPNINEFWQQMKQQKPDMVVLDVILPDGNGLDLCSKLKRDVKTYAIPVMIMSAGNQLSQLKAKCEAEDFINKPFDLNDFVHRVEHYMAS